MTAVRSRRSLLAALVVLVLAAAAGVVIAVALPGKAAARAESRIEPLADAPIAPQLKAGIATAAQRAKANGVQEVAAQGASATDRAGIAVAHAAGGREVFAFFTPHSFTDFYSAADLTAATPLIVQTSIRAASDGSTGHVDIMGVVPRSVKSVTLQLVSGSSLPADLVNAGGGYSYFTYTSDTPTKFPQNVQAFAADGDQVAAHDLTADIAPPTNAG